MLAGDCRFCLIFGIGMISASLHMCSTMLMLELVCIVKEVVGA